MLVLNLHIRIFWENFKGILHEYSAKLQRMQNVLAFKECYYSCTDR